jgi:hypothetical protein
MAQLRKNHRLFWQGDNGVKLAKVSALAAVATQRLIDLWYGDSHRLFLAKVRREKQVTVRFFNITV